MNTHTVQPQDYISLLTPAQHQRQQMRDSSPCQTLWNLLDAIKDPEIPVVSIWDLGILQRVEQDPVTQQVTVTITPTYSGCPAVEMIGDDIKALLQASGYRDSQIKTALAPAWTTDWITPTGRSQLQQFGIAPPIPCIHSLEGQGNERVQGKGKGQEKVQGHESTAVAIACPQCDSRQTIKVSEFGSTACKAAYRCDACGEAFDYFKHF